MAAAQGIPLLPHHQASPDQALGTVETGWTDGQSFRVAGTLKLGSPDAWALMKSIQAGKSYALSVGGRVLQAFWGYDDAVAGPVRFIEEVELDHLALCQPEEAVNPETGVTPVASGETAGLEAGGEEREAGNGGGADPLSPAVATLPPVLCGADSAASPASGGESGVTQEDTGGTPVPPAEPQAETPAPPDLVAQVEELRRQVAALQELLQQQLSKEAELQNEAPAEAQTEAELAQQAQAEPPAPPAEPGRRQSLPVTRPGGARGRAEQKEPENLWRGVL